MSQTAASTTSSMLDHAARWFSAKKPQPIKPTRRGVASTRSSSPRLWDFAGGAKRLAHSCAVEVGAAGPIEDYLLPPRHEIDRLRQRAHRSRWDDHRAVHVRVDDIVAANKHPENVRVAVHLHHVNMGVTRPDPAADDLEAWREHVDVANEPLVTQPATPRPACTVVCTSPQNAPNPGRSSMSWMTAIVGKPSAATYSYQSSRGGIGP